MKPHLEQGTVRKGAGEVGEGGGGGRGERVGEGRGWERGEGGRGGRRWERGEGGRGERVGEGGGGGTSNLHVYIMENVVVTGSVFFYISLKS